MSTAVQPAKSPAPLRVLLVGDKEEDFFLIREILERSRESLAAELNHAHTLGEAKEMLQQQPYGLVLFEHDTGDAGAIRLLADFLQPGVSLPFILLTEDANEETVAQMIKAGQWNCVARSQLDGATLIRSIHNALALHSMQQEQHAAAESLRKLSRAVEQSADTVVITDRRGVIEFVNPAFEALTGYTHEEVCGKNPRILKSGHQGPEVYREMWETIMSGNVYRGILVNKKKNGELFYIDQSISPVRDLQGRIAHFISTGHDLTEQMRLQAQLMQAQKMDAVGRLAGGIAHDFNNLLTIITSYSELALDDAVPGSSLESKLQEILLAARRAAELTRQLLALSRKQPQALRVLDLNNAMANVAKTLHRLIGEDIEFSFTPGQGLGLVRMDPFQIEQIMMNLAANARDAMPQGGHFRIETSHVTIDEEWVHRKPVVIATGEYSLITVSDNGAGIAAEHLPHIFEPFYTTKAVGEGTGLGLATVYGIVKQNKGFIWAYSELGMGTVFKIYLPCVARAGVEKESKRPKPEAVPRGSETVLLVEDEPAVRNASAEFLRHQGYTVLEAGDGVEALHVASRHDSAIHLVVTDVVMPNMSGGQLAHEMARLRPATRILFVSGYAGKTVLDHKVVDIETNFLQKPYSLKQLAGKIRTALQPQ